LDTIGPQDAEQNIFGQFAAGLDHADYMILRAPRPTLVLAGTQDFFNIEGTWDSFRQAKRPYTRLGAAERISIVETDTKHGYPRAQREGDPHHLTDDLDVEVALGPEVVVDQPSCDAGLGGDLVGGHRAIVPIAEQTPGGGEDLTAALVGLEAGTLGALGGCLTDGGRGHPGAGG
jgi:hypothetical protein